MRPICCNRHNEDLLAPGKGLADSAEEADRPAAGAAGNRPPGLGGGAGPACAHTVHGGTANGSLLAYYFPGCGEEEHCELAC